jgi:hypothetical protein
MDLDEVEDDDEIFLRFAVRCGERTASTVSDDVSAATAQPTAEVFALLPPNVDLDDLPNLVGSEIAVTHWRTNPKRDLWNRLYYWEHEDLWDVVVRVIGHRDGCFDVRWSASSRDVNNLDRAMRVQVDASFRSLF